MMKAGAPPLSPGEGYGDEHGLADLRSETLKMLIAVILGLGYVAVMATIMLVPSDTPPALWEPLPLLFGLLATAGATHASLRLGPAISAATMVAGLLATLTGSIFLHPGSLLAGYYFVIVIAATGAFDWRAGLSAALLSSGAILGTLQFAPAVIPVAVAEQALVFVWLTLPLAWLPTRPLHATMNWAWSSYVLAQAKTEEARRHQAELVRVSKSLSEACDRLERLNRELHEARDAADSARRMKAEFAATVGHELRTPINLIIGFSQMMASPRRATYYTEPLPESYRGDVETIHHNASHISSLVDDILDLSQIDAHRMALRKEPTALSRVAHDAAASVASLYAEAGLYLSVDVPTDLPRVPADPVRIRQVLINLLYNAVRFTHCGGVVITAHFTDADAVVSVHDTGVGIPPGELARVFDEFRQIQSPSRGHVGSGLGLAVCKRFIELHGGNIWAESDLDSGTTISFSLPLHDNVAATPFHNVPLPGAPPDHERASVAVLDPSGETIRIIQRYLDGYRVREVKRPERASQLAKKTNLHAMVVTSPAAQQAWDSYQRAHDEVKAVPTLVCPLRTRETIAQTLNAAAYLTKPVTREQLARVLRQLPRPARRLVVIEDDPEMRTLLVRMLRSLSRHYTVAEADDGTTGLVLIRQSLPDAVLLDLLMPRQDGYAVLNALRDDSRLSATPVVVISAKGPDEQVLVDMVGITRHDGLSVGEAMDYLKTSLDALRRLHQLPDDVAETGGTVRVPRVGSPV